MRTARSLTSQGSTGIVVVATLMAVVVWLIVSFALRQRSKTSEGVRSIKPQDMAEAGEAYEKGFKYYRGGGNVLIDHRQAFADFNRAAELGLPEAQARLAELVGIKYGLEFLSAPDEKKAAEWAKKALASGLEKKAEAKERRAEYELGSLYLYGIGVTRDYAKAAELFEHAANHADSDAKRALGFLYFAGQGVSKDWRTAERYFLEAAADRIATAQLLLGLLYLAGDKDVAKNPSKAVELFRNASDQGLTSAYERLGYCYEKGDGVAQDYGRAAELYQKGADRGNWSALMSLGSLYERGEGVPKDLDKAAELYRRVAEQGIKQGKEALARIRP